MLCSPRTRCAAPRRRRWPGRCSRPGPRSGCSCCWLGGAGEGFFTPAMDALTVELAPRGQLGNANALYGLASSATRIAGPALLERWHRQPGRAPPTRSVGGERPPFTGPCHAARRIRLPPWGVVRGRLRKDRSQHEGGLPWRASVEATSASGRGRYCQPDGVLMTDRKDQDLTEGWRVPARETARQPACRAATRPRRSAGPPRSAP